MATIITPECINCAACQRECPNHAIRPGDQYFVIDPDLCTECVGYFDRAACQAVCPVECCRPDPARDQTEEQLIDKALRIHSDDAALKAKVDANDFPSRFRKVR